MKKKTLLWTLGLVVVLAGGAGAGVFAYKKAQKKAADAPLTESYKVARSNLRLQIKSYGSVEPENRVDVKAPVSGAVESILVEEGDKVATGAILAYVSTTERAVLINAARAQGPEEVKKWTQIYKPIPIIAPVSGTIIVRNIKPGQSFSSSDAIFVMSDKLIVRALVDEIDINKIKVGQSSTILLDSWPAEGIPAVVKRIGFDSRSFNNVIKYVVDLEPKSTPSYMLSGMTASITFLIEEKQNVLLVPRQALKREDGSWTAQKINGKDKNGVDILASQTVKVGDRDDQFIEIIEGLSEGALISMPKALDKEKTAGKASTQVNL